MLTIVANLYDPTMPQKALQVFAVAGYILCVPVTGQFLSKFPFSRLLLDPLEIPKDLDSQNTKYR